VRGRVDEEHAGSQRVQAVGELGCLHLVQIDHLADQEGAADMRGDELEAPTHLVVDEAVAQVPKLQRDSATCCRFFHDGEQAVGESLRSQPLLGEACPAEFLAQEEVGNPTGLPAGLAAAPARLTYLFISHDLSLVRSFADRLAVMYLGRVCELGQVCAALDRPRHHYTLDLLWAVPIAVVRRTNRCSPRMAYGPTMEST
jgi:hypothetical protein